jgi:hypothetical protein
LWHLKGGETGLEGSLDHWDYKRDLEITQHLKVDVDASLKDLKLEDTGASLQVVVVGETGDPLHPPRRWICHSGFQGLAGGYFDREIEVSIRGQELATVLKLTTEILLDVPPSNPIPLSPKQTGSRLFSSEQQIVLEGSMARLPVIPVDFEKSFKRRGISDAMWFLDCGQDWNSSESSQLSLYINNRKKGLVEELQADNPVIDSFLAGEVTRTILAAALNSDEVFSPTAEDFSEGSLGYVAIQIRNLVFDDEDPEVTRSMLNERPGEFAARIHSVFGRPSR